MDYAGIRRRRGIFRGLLMRIGGSIAVGLMVFGLLSVPSAVYAQQDAPPIYVTPNSDHSAQPLFLRKLFGTDEPNSGVGTPKPYDFSHRNDLPENQGISQEEQAAAHEAYMRALEEEMTGVRAIFDQRHAEQVAEAQQDAQNANAVLASIRASSVGAAQAAQQQALQHRGAGNFVHKHGRKERPAHTHAHAGQSGEAPPIYVQH